MTAQRCTYIHPDKNRQCHLPTKFNTTTCGVHSATSQPCPHCGTPLPPPSLSRHVSKPLCPVLKRLHHTQSQPWYCHNINHATNITPLPSALPIDISALTALTTSLLTRFAPLTIRAPLPLPLPEDKTIREEWSCARDSTLKMQHKHFSQMSSLASLLLPAVSEKSQCSDPHLILELGAGRAYTSLYLAHVLRLRAIPTHVLAIDRATNRLKADRTLRQWASDPATSILSFKRLRLDIQHLHIAGIADIASCHKVVVVGKHVCGVALDLSLVAVTKFAREWRNGEGCITVALACCCRRLCCWGAFCGAGEKEGEEGKEGKEEESLCKRWGVSELDFGQLCRSANWGLDEGHSEEMKEMGEASREVVDSLRVLWMRRNGWHANVVVYTDASPENVCIVARWCGNSN